MPRIRTIKPEFPQSESVGRLSRDARLLFILMWTLCDDSGRARASSRMLASLLYPYDEDAPTLISGWLDELDTEGCVKFYRVGSDTYLQITNWLKHQKIDKPSASKIPEFVEASRIFAKPRERSSGDQGPKDQGRDQGPLSVKKHSDAKASVNLFNGPLEWLMSATNKSEQHCRGLIGRFRKQSGNDDGAVFNAMTAAQKAGAVEPVSYITAALKPKPKKKTEQMPL